MRRGNTLFPWHHHAREAREPFHVKPHFVNGPHSAECAAENEVKSCDVTGAWSEHRHNRVRVHRKINKRGGGRLSAQLSVDTVHGCQTLNGLSETWQLSGLRFSSMAAYTPGLQLTCYPREPLSREHSTWTTQDRFKTVNCVLCVI